MNVNPEDFNNSDAWLSEQLFAQLRDFNAAYKANTTELNINDIYQNSSNSMPLLEEDDVQPQDFTKTHLDSYEDVFKSNNLAMNYDVNAEVLDLSQTAAMSKLHDKILEPPENEVDFKTTLPFFTKAVGTEAEVSSNKMQQNMEYNPSEEELKILQLLENQTNDKFKDTKTFVPSELPPTAFCIVKCSNCNALFDLISFQSHVCDYDDQHHLIPTTPSADLPKITKPIKEEAILPAEPACIRLLKENQIRIRRFLKDELKYDVNAANNNSTSSNSSLNNSLNNSSAMSTSTSSNSGLNSSSISTLSSSTSSTKKQDGPHECSLCERKFVHASGLLRHMEKHAMDLIPSTNAGTSNKSTAGQGNSLRNVNNLRVVIKCTLCGRIFFEPISALKHLCSHFPSTKTDEEEMDNFAEIPYDSYVDDALSCLLKEIQESNANTNYQEEKPPQYLKMVILSCILQCEFCDMIFSEVSYLFVHSACHLPERRFECFACEIHVKTSKEISTHWQAECVFMRENLKVHQAYIQRYFVCNVCENKFQSMDQLHEHRYTSYHFFPRLSKFYGILKLPCEYCESIFDNAHECVAHYEEKHYKKYKKDKDGSGASSSKTRQYLCDICGKSYTQSSHLWQHLRFHQGVKPFACKEPGCTRKFTIRPDLNDHIRKCHTGERPYHCLVCGKRFLTGSVFYQHRLIHRGERRYECEECGKRFYRADALKNHQRIHTGEKPFGCPFCTKNFRQRGDRDKHIRARHSHLDANSRLMMQMHKLQLEAAAALNEQSPQTSNDNNLSFDINNENVPPSSYSSTNKNNLNDDIMLGNIAFPRGMLDSLIPDIDEDSVLRTMQQ